MAETATCKCMVCTLREEVRTGRTVLSERMTRVVREWECEGEE